MSDGTTRPCDFCGGVGMVITAKELGPYTCQVCEGTGRRPTTATDLEREGQLSLLAQHGKEQ